jgi:hypothetical protein
MPRQLRVCLAEPAGANPIRLADLRASLVADLIRRVAESHHSQVSAWLHCPGGTCELRSALRAAWDGLNIYPLDFAEQPPGPADVSVTAARAGARTGAQASPGTGPRATAEALLVRVGDTEGTAFPPNGLTGGVLDPLGLRYAFLTRHYQERLWLPWQTLQEADQALREWRKRVAGWATSPSQPMSADHLRDALAAFDHDLDTPAVLATLHALNADDETTPGAKFETVAYLDRLLGLDLAREVGR